MIRIVAYIYVYEVYGHTRSWVFGPYSIHMVVTIDRHAVHWNQGTMQKAESVL
jgi:hypothetical protein